MTYKLSFGQGGVRVRMSDGLDKLVRKALAELYPGLVDRIERETEELYAEARREWPVRSGMSRDGLRRTVQIAPGFARIRGVVWNDVRYARWIKPKALFGTKTAFQAYLREPLKRRRKQLVEDLKVMAVARMKGRR